MLHLFTSSQILFQWNTAAESAFKALKEIFPSEPLLTAPDLTLQFIVEVDASEVGMGAILSQRSPQDDKLHPCAYLSGKLTSAEQNHDIGKRELLEVKVALEEWSNWLEGVKQQFLVLTDHRNLEYLQSA